MAKIKIALVDDELTARNTIKKYLEDSENYEVVADFQNGKTALESLRKKPGGHYSVRYADAGNEWCGIDEEHTYH